MRLGSRAKLTLLAGVAVACVFAFLGIRELRETARRAEPPQAQPQQQLAVPGVVLAVTTRPIRTGETISSDMFRNAPSDPGKHPGVATTTEVLGKVATRDIPANTLIARTALTPETRLAIRVPMGMRAISIETTDEIAVAGLIRPGDRVDVQVVYPGEDALSGARRDGRSSAATLLQMVQVLAVGGVVVGTPPASGGLDGVSPPPQPARTVTLALAPGQVSTLSLAKNTGALYLSLRNPEDGELAEADHVGTAAAPPLVRAVSAPRRAAPASRPTARAADPAPKPIELVVGGREKTIFSGGAVR